jgi:hypothetical protein
VQIPPQKLGLVSSVGRGVNMLLAPTCRVFPQTEKWGVSTPFKFCTFPRLPPPRKGVQTLSCSKQRLAMKSLNYKLLYPSSGLYLRCKNAENYMSGLESGPGASFFLPQDSTACRYCFMRLSLLPLRLPRKSGLPSKHRYNLSWSLSNSLVTPLMCGHPKSVCCEIFARRAFSFSAFWIRFWRSSRWINARFSVATATRSSAVSDSRDSNRCRASFATAA